MLSCKKNSPDHPSLFSNGTIVPKVNEQKHLGLFDHCKLSFERHFFNEKKGIIKYLSKFFPPKTFDQMYNTLVRTHLDYCDIIYHHGLYGRICHIVKLPISKIGPYWGKYAQISFYIISCITRDCIIVENIFLI